MKKILLTAIILLLSTIAVSAQNSVVLKAGVSMIDRVPKQLFGTWRVMSKLVETDNPKVFSKTGIDLWNISREKNVIRINNPVTGAAAEVFLDAVEDDYIEFSKNAKFENQVLIDTVKIRIIRNKFSGYNELTLKTYSGKTQQLVKTNRAVYNLTGDKLLGNSIKED